MNNKKIIAICTTKIQSQERVSFVENLYNTLDKTKYKIIVFNSPSDFYNNAPSDKGAMSTYDIINYNKVDCVIIDRIQFQSESIFLQIINKAKENNTPVIVMNDVVDDCFCVVPNYDSTYKEVIEHLITEHHYNDFFFIGGIKGEPESENRFRIFKEAIDAYDIPFDDSKFDYGNFYELAVYDIFDNLYANKKLPQVFVCANDTMAYAIYQKAQEYNLKIPNDIAVVGFDGLYYSKYLTPPLTSCRRDENHLALFISKIINDICCKSAKPEIYDSLYESVWGSSCGCTPRTESLNNNIVFNAFRNVERINHYQEHSFNIIEKTIEFDYQDNIYEILMSCAVPQASICINSDFYSAMFTGINEENSFSDKFYVLTTQDNINDENHTKKPYDFSDMIPDFDKWMDEDTLYMVTSIHAGDSICGHYAIKENENIEEMAQRFNRTSRTINIVMSEALSRYKQKNITSQKTKLLNINTITGLPNLKGLVNWFKSFSSYHINHKKNIMVSLYWIPAYKEIYEKYGVEESQQITNYISETLRIANSRNSYIAHISEDEFVVINYVDKNSEVALTINNATNMFFGIRDNFVQEKRKHYNDDSFIVEVNCGCTVVDKNWPDTIDIIELIKLARAEMFINRYKYSKNNIETTCRTAREDYHALMLLINNNLFLYHYQPIIDIDKKDIYAYEALMRTDSNINLSPIDILTTATSYKRLYDVERATVFNVMDQYSKGKEEKFKSRKIFVNSIPGYFLNNEDISEVKNRYSQFLDSFVFEITEQDVASDEELEQIKHLGTEDLHIPIAIDDYGSGLSNIVNLLRYSPQIIKIDRFLITDIDTDTNKQMFVKGTIEFAAANNIKVLAEGVETQEEFKTVVRLGINYVQGYYTGKPSAEPLAEIPDFVVDDINSVKIKL